MKNKVLSYVFFGVFLAMYVAGMVLLYLQGAKLRHQIDINTLEITFYDKWALVSEENIRKRVDDIGGTYIGRRIEDMDLASIEEGIEALESAVDDCQCWVTNDGVLHVSIRQRKPVLRFEGAKQQFYADKWGNIFPLQGETYQDAMVVRGDVGAAKSHAYLEGMLQTVAKIHADPFWDVKVQSLEILPGGDMVLICTDGLHIQIGDHLYLDKKLQRANRYFSSIAPNVGSHTYKSINVKYNNQIICRTDTLLQ